MKRQHEYVTQMGVFVLDEAPTCKMRKDGQPDLRTNKGRQWAAYFVFLDSMAEMPALSSQHPIMTFREWKATMKAEIRELCRP